MKKNKARRQLKRWLKAIRLAKMIDYLPKGELPVVYKLHIVVERSISDWQRAKKSLLKIPNSR